MHYSPLSPFFTSFFGLFYLLRFLFAFPVFSAILCPALLPRPNRSAFCRNGPPSAFSRNGAVCFRDFLSSEGPVSRIFRIFSGYSPRFSEVIQVSPRYPEFSVAFQTLFRRKATAPPAKSAGGAAITTIRPSGCFAPHFPRPPQMISPDSGVHQFGNDVEDFVVTAAATRRAMGEPLHFFKFLIHVAERLMGM